MAKKRPKKGTYSDLRLPVAAKYLRPSSRRPLILLGLAGIVLFAGYVAADYFLAGAGFVSNGPLSSSHAVLEDTDDGCEACHGGGVFGDVARARCSACHEPVDQKPGDPLGVYTYGAHYLYRSTDFQRAVPAAREVSCAGCHPEHQGRGAAMTQVADARCRTCHDWASFVDGHPPFAAAADEIADETALVFPHIQHVREVLKRLAVVDHERACLFCHTPRDDGRGFQPLSFDGHCDACHLTAVERTEPVPVAAGGEPGVLTLAAIRDARAPGSEWALFLSPAEFRERGGLVSKSPVYHRDPWVMTNLRLLRRRLYEDAGLAELLQASAEVPASELATLYEEAVATLESYAVGLRSRSEPEIQADLRKIDKVTAELRRALGNPYTALDETAFLLALESRRPGVDDAEVAAVEEVAFQLGLRCFQCHYDEALTIARVQKDQRVLRRAEFNHRAHILEVRCLECHGKIPFLDYLDESIPVAEIDPELDHAGILNLPGIERCRECHNPRLVSQSCTTCHLFHPDKSRYSRLLLYVGDD